MCYGFSLLEEETVQSPQFPGPISFQLLVWVPCKPPTPGRTACLETALLKVYKPKGLMRKLPLLSYKGPFSLRKAPELLPIVRGEPALSYQGTEPYCLSQLRLL